MEILLKNDGGRMENELDGIEVDYQQMETEMSAMGNAINEFIQAGENIFTNELANFEAMNSDFIEKYVRIVETLRDHHIYNLSSNLTILFQNSQTILQSLKDTDKSYCTTEGENGYGGTE